MVHRPFSDLTKDDSGPQKYLGCVKFDNIDKAEKKRKSKGLSSTALVY